MKLRLVFTLTLMLLVLPATQADQHATTIRAKADAYAASLKGGDFVTLASLTYPRVVEFMGGREGMIDRLSAGMEQMKQEGFEMLAFRTKGLTDAVTAGGELHAIVNTEVEMSMPDGRMRNESFLLAISSDGGSSWTFVDGAALSPASVGQLFPNWNDALKLPERKEPVRIDAEGNPE